MELVSKYHKESKLWNQSGIPMGSKQEKFTLKRATSTQLLLKTSEYNQLCNQELQQEAPLFYT